MDGRLTREKIASVLFKTITGGCILLLVVVALSLLYKSLPLLSQYTLSQIFLSEEWLPHQGKFGMLSFVVGTLSVTGLAMLLAVPVSLMTAIYLSEYAPRVAAVLRPLIDLLSSIPSVIYGVWGVLTVVPAVQKLSEAMGGYSSGYSLLAGAIVLAIMVCPFMVHVAYEVMVTVPKGLREASLSLGATRWQTIKHVVTRRALPGLVAAVVLGLSRAFGETIAVLMVAGNVPLMPRSVFDPVYPLPALLANNYGEMMSVPLYDSALLFSAFVLLVVVLVFNGLARLALNIVHKGV